MSEPELEDDVPIRRTRSAFQQRAIWSAAAFAAWIVLCNIPSIPMPGAPFSVTLSIAALGVWPWLNGIAVVQLGLAFFPGAAERLSARDPVTRRALLTFVMLTGGTMVVLQLWGLAIWASQLSFSPGFAVRAPSTGVYVAKMLVGCLLVGGVAMVMQRFGLGLGLTLIVCADELTKLGRYQHALGDMGRATLELRSFQLVALVLVGVLSYFATRRTIAVAPRGKDGPVLAVPLMLAGVAPLGMAYSMATFAQLAKMPFLAGFPATAVATLLAIAVSLRVLYPASRRARVLGPHREAYEELLEPSVSRLTLANAAFALLVVVAVDRWLSGSIGTCPPAVLPWMLGALAAAVPTAVRARAALEVEHGPLVEAVTVHGALEAEVARAWLAHAGVPSAQHAWLVPALHAVSIPGGGEIAVLVPAVRLEDARRALESSPLAQNAG